MEMECFNKEIRNEDDKQESSTEMECLNIEIRNEDHQESRDSQAHEMLDLTESDEDASGQGETTFDELSVVDEELSDDEENDELKLARAVTRVALEGFRAIDWDWWDESFVDHRKVFKKFKLKVFEAMAWFVYTLYDKEDFKNIAFTSNIYDECTAFWKLIFTKRNPSSLRIDMRRFKYLHEQDIGNMIQYYKETPTSETNLMKDFSSFQSQVLLHPNSLDEKYIQKYARHTKDVIDNHVDVLEEKHIKRHLLMELNDCKCFCTMDALYMESWKKMPLETLRKSVSTKVLENLVSNIHTIFYDMSMRRIERLHKCERLVTKTLSIFGSFDSNVVEVVEWADLERRTQGRRFISANDLRTSLNKMILVGRMELQYSKSSDEYTIYNVYQMAQEIAKRHGYQIIGVKQLCQALRETDISGARLPIIDTRIKNQRDDIDETSTTNKLWKIVDNNNDGTRLIKDSILTVVENIQDRNFSPLKEIKEALKKLYSKQSLTTLSSGFLGLKSQNLSFVENYPSSLKKTVNFKKSYYLRSKKKKVITN